MTTIDFISIRGQQNFEDDAEIKPVEIKIANDLLFSSATKNETEKTFIIKSALTYAKYDFINGKHISNNWRN